MHKIVDVQFTQATVRCLFIKFPLVSSKLAVQSNVTPFWGDRPEGIFFCRGFSPSGSTMIVDVVKVSHDGISHRAFQLIFMNAMK